MRKHSHDYRQLSPMAGSLLDADASPPASDVSDGSGRGFFRFREAGTGSTLGAVFNVANASLGAGVLSFPFAFRHTGLLGGLMLTLALALLSYIGATIINVYQDKFGAATYQELVRLALGRRAELVLQAFIVVYTIGSCITYLIVIGDQMRPVVEHWADPDTWYADRRVLITAVAVVGPFPLMLLRRISALSFTSFLACAAVTYLSVVVVLFGLYGGANARGVLPSESLPDDVGFFVLNFDSLLAFPIICFAFQCHVSVAPVYADMKNRRPRVFRRVLAAALTLCFVLYVMCGAFGFISFGRGTSSDILMLFDNSDSIILVARVAVTVVAACSYPLLNFLGRLCVDDIVRAWLEARAVANGEPPPPEHSRTRFLVETAVTAVFTLGVAIVVKDIGDVIDIVGGTAVVAFVFAYPGLFLVSSRAAVRAGWALIVIGITLGTLSTTASIKSDVS